MHAEGIAGLWKGIIAMNIRDVPAWGSYFWANEFFKEEMGVNEAQKRGEDWNMVNFTKRLIVAGIAGMISWGISYPFDIVNTEVKCMATRRLTIREALRRGYQKEGVRYFFKGMVPTQQRAFVITAVTLPLYDYLMQFYMPKK